MSGDIEAIRQRCKEVGHVLGSCSLEGDFKPGLLGEMHGYVQTLLAALDAVTASRDEYIRLWQQVTAGLLDVQAERDQAVRERDEAQDRWGEERCKLNEALREVERLRAALDAAAEGLWLAGILCDAIPTQAHTCSDEALQAEGPRVMRALGGMVNGQGFYQIIRDAEQQARAALARGGGANG